MTNQTKVQMVRGTLDPLFWRIQFEESIPNTSYNKGDYYVCEVSDKHQVTAGTIVLARYELRLSILDLVLEEVIESIDRILTSEPESKVKGVSKTKVTKVKRTQPSMAKLPQKAQLWPSLNASWIAWHHRPSDSKNMNPLKLEDLLDSKSSLQNWRPHTEEEVSALKDLHKLAILSISEGKKELDLNWNQAPFISLIKHQDDLTELIHNYLEACDQHWQKIENSASSTTL